MALNNLTMVLRFSSFFLLLTLLVNLARAQNDSDASSSGLISSSGSSANPNTTFASPSSSSTTATETRVVQIFYIDERAYDGLPYTLFHRVSGVAVAADASQTTFVITSTFVDQRSYTTASSQAGATTENVTSTSTTTVLPPTTISASSSLSSKGTGQPSTITQGPATFMFTGTRFGPDNTIINQCSLNGTLFAACNLTHVGRVWYTGETSWDGRYSTYSYTWTSGDLFGFAPVTITSGAELLSAAEPTSSGEANAAASGRRPCGRIGLIAVIMVLILAVIVAL
jgi:hypothetical protein